MATPSDLTQTGKNLVFGLINNANPGLVNGALDTTNVTLGNPSALNGDASGKNTKVTVTAIAGQGYTGTADVKYNRLNLQTDVADLILGGAFSLVDADYATVADLLTAINAALGLTLQAADLSNAATAISGTYPKTATVTVATTHLALFGSLTVTITEPQLDLATEVTVLDLDGIPEPGGAH